MVKRTSKYLPLVEYLKALTVNQVRLSFTEIERLLGAKLPKSAHDHDAWWGNHSHNHADLWGDAGWTKYKHDRTRKWVVFRRTGPVEHYQIGDPKAQEGYEYDAKVVLRTRNAALALKRKRKDNYTCQACGFHLQIAEAYVIEVHHLDPLSASGERETTIDMLVSLCPTCHCIAHLRSIPYTVEEITKLRTVPLP